MISLHTVFLLSYMAWIVSETGILARDIRSRGGEMRDNGSRSVVILAMVVSITAAMFLQHVRWAQLPIPRAAGVGIGVALMLAGIVLRQWAVWTLGEFFTTHVRLLDGHRLIESGPYARLRNPSYTGALVTCLGFGLASGSGLSLLVMLVLPGAALAYRIGIEESALADRFGAAWQSYRARRWALVPPLW